MSESAGMPTTAYGLIYLVVGLLLSNIGMWIREWLKHRSWKRNNGSIETIKTLATETKTEVGKTQNKVDCLDRKMGSAREDIREVKTAVKAQTSHCKTTVAHINTAITENSKQIFELAKDKGGKD
jgi:chromosome segregation ATPase